MGPIPRPLTVTVLAALWMASVLVWGCGGLLTVALGGVQGTLGAITVILSVGSAIVAVLMGYGLWTRAGWARVLQIVLAALPAVGVCGPYFIACAAVLAYMLRPEVKIVFSGRYAFRDLSPTEAETVRKGAPEGLFTAVIVGGALVGTLLSGGIVFAARVLYAGQSEARIQAGEAAALGQIRTVMSAQEAFRAGTCGTGYADVEGLTNPSSVIPNYPAGGPPFVNAEWARPEGYGYRFVLAVDEPVPPAPNCPTRSFQRYTYSATALEQDGRRSFLAASDGVIHAAQGRAATLEDPPTQ